MKTQPNPVSSARKQTIKSSQSRWKVWYGLVVFASVLSIAAFIWQPMASSSGDTRTSVREINSVDQSSVRSFKREASRSSGGREAATPRSRETKPSRPAMAAAKGFPTVQEALAAARHAVRPVPDDESVPEASRGAKYFAYNPAQKMVARFYDQSVSVSSSKLGSDWSLELNRAGVRPIASSSERRVEYSHADGVIEWYENNDDGLQHGFDVPSRPAGSEPGKLRMRMETKGLTTVADPANADGLCFTDRKGRALAAYRGLKAWDARGRELTANMYPVATGFEIAVDDSEAVYPVQIDPYFLNLEQIMISEMGGTGYANDRFGSAVAIDGDTAVVTAQNALFGPDGRGRAYVFVRQDSLWSLQAELWADDGNTSDEFGNAVALDGDTLAVGSKEWDDYPYYSDRGCVYVYKRSAGKWTLETQLTSPTSGGSEFGYALDIDGDELLIGSNSTKAYLFSKATGSWQFANEIVASTGSGAYGFGTAVALDGDVILIGAPREFYGGFAQVGVAYAFKRDGSSWVESQRIFSPYSATESRFASQVALDGDTAIIGSPDAVTDTRNGQFDIYRMDGAGMFVAETINHNGVHYPLTGGDVAISGDRVVIGCWVWSSSAQAVLYERTGNVWSWKQTFDHGSSVAMDGTNLLIGAYSDRGDGDSGTTYGSAHIYELDQSVWIPQQRLTMGNSRSDANLGNSVELQNNTLAVGAADEPSATGNSVGAVYVMVKVAGSWQLQARLVADSPERFPYFGGKLALDGDTLAVAATTDCHVASDGTITPNVGSVTVFTRSGTQWSIQQKMYSDDLTQLEGFGHGLAIQGDQLLIGAPNHFTGTGSGDPYRGCVYWFQRSGSSWTQQSKFLSGNSRSHQRFGNAISIDGNTALIAAYRLETQYTYSGRVCVFTFNGSDWNRQALISPPSPKAFIGFGTSVSISGNTALIGAPGVDEDGVLDFNGNKGTGQAYVYTRSGTQWSLQATFDPVDGHQYSYFGNSLKVDGDNAVISQKGGVDLYTRSGTTWTRQGTYQSAANPSDTNFASAVAMDGDAVAVGSPKMDRVREDIHRTYSHLGSVEIYNITNTHPSLIITSPSRVSVSLPDTSVALQLTAAIDSHGSAATPVIAWSKVNGPGTVSFTAASSASTHATFSMLGNYVLQCSVSVGGFTTTRTRTVKVGEHSVMTFREGVNAYVHGAATLMSENTSTNLGASPELHVGKTDGRIRRSVLSFDLKALPANAVVHGVALQTTTSNTPGSGTVSDVELWSIPHSFTEGFGNGSMGYTSGATWNRKSDLADNELWFGESHEGGTLLSSVDGYNAQTQTSTDKIFASTANFVTEAQSAVIAGRLNLVLRSPVSEADMGEHLTIFHSDDAISPNVRPMLSISYSLFPAPVIADGALATPATIPCSLLGLIKGGNAAQWSQLSGPGTATFSDATGISPMVTFDQEGSYVLTVVVSNEFATVSRSVSVEVSAAPPNPGIFADWIDITWPDENDLAVTGMHSDPDKDGLSNLLEWALHLDATKADAPTPVLNQEEGVLTYRYTRRILAEGEGSFQVQWSGTLNDDWDPAQITEETITPLSATSESVLVTMPAGTNGQRFVRVKFVKN
ncbi:hypothetical protein NT6N_25820 [Oceaniferula spumae]|uniref:Ig-like domain-containing protein n=1 Tax=Oceaniferula spumae TaxID=2979115 RepID=A0AAT9FNJ8_9BACT